MIHTVTLNPAIDHTVSIPGFTLNSVNRIDSSRRDPGGKGLNVSKVIQTLGGTSIAHGFIGGESGRWLQANLAKRGIETRFVTISGETRTNLKVVDPVNGSHTDINDQGPLIEAQELQQLEEGLFGLIVPGDLLVLSGSTPRGIDKSIYGRWIERARKIGACTILDADGEVLRTGAAAGPDLIKPNIHELEKIAPGPLGDLKQVTVAARGLISKPNGMVVVSLGGDGALFINAQGAIRAEGLKVPVKSTLGAGDAMVAALALHLSHGKAMEDLVVPALAAGTAAVGTEGSEVFTKEAFDQYAKLVRYSQF